MAVKKYNREAYLEITENLSQKPYIYLRDAIFLLECEWYKRVSDDVPDSKSFLDIFEGKYIAIKEKSDLSELLDRAKIPDPFFGLLKDILFSLLILPYNKKWDIQNVTASELEELDNKGIPYAKIEFRVSEEGTISVVSLEDEDKSYDFASIFLFPTPETIGKTKYVAPYFGGEEAYKKELNGIYNIEYEDAIKKYCEDNGIFLNKDATFASADEKDGI